jgi:release factor glutamine methyltransferase
LLAAAGCAGARHLCGVDIEPNAVAATRRLLRLQCHSANLEVHHGEMFEPVEGRRFDLVVTNLPQFPMDEAEVDGRLVSWSAGGADGRMLIDRFIGSLAAHLAPGGRALATHNDFIGLDRTCAAAAHLGLTVQIVQKFMVPLPNSKLAVMSEDVLKREIGHSIRRFGNHTFGMVSILSLEHSKAGERHT